jgi:hypothetical protein
MKKELVAAKDLEEASRRKTISQKKANRRGLRNKVYFTLKII